MTRTPAHAHGKKKEKSLTSAEKLEDLLRERVAPERLDILHDQLKLLGIVMGQRALLQALLDIDASVKDKVSAAKTLVAMQDETPGAIVERLRGSAMSGLSAEELEAIIVELGSVSLKELDLDDVVKKIKGDSDVGSIS